MSRSVLRAIAVLVFVLVSPLSVLSQSSALVEGESVRRRNPDFALDAKIASFWDKFMALRKAEDWRGQLECLEANSHLFENVEKVGLLDAFGFNIFLLDANAYFGRVDDLHKVFGVCKNILSRMPAEQCEDLLKENPIYKYLFASFYFYGGLLKSQVGEKKEAIRSIEKCCAICEGSENSEIIRIYVVARALLENYKSAKLLSSEEYLQARILFFDRLNSLEVAKGYEAAISCIEQHSHLFLKNGHLGAYGDFQYYALLIREHIYFGRLDVAKRFVDRCAEAFDRMSADAIPYLESDSTSCYYLVPYYFAKASKLVDEGYLGDAEVFYRKCYDVLQGVEEKIGLDLFMDVCLAIGNFYVGLNNLSNAESVLLYAKLKSDYHQARYRYLELLRSLGSVYYSAGYYVMAKMYFEEEMCLRTEGGIDDVRGAEGWLAFCYYSLGNVEKAKALCLSIIENIDKIKDADESLSAAYILLGWIFFDEGDYLSASEYNKKAYDINHAIAASAYMEMGLVFNMALSQYMLGDKDYKRFLSSFSERIVRDVAQKFAFMSSDERQRYHKRSDFALSLYNSLLFLSGDNSCYGRIYENVLFSKALLLRAENKIVQQLSMPENSELLSEFNKMISLRELLANENVSRTERDSLSNVISSIEKRIVNQLSGSQNDGTIFNFEQYDCRSVSKALEADEAVVEFVDFFEASALVGKEQGKFYAAIVIRKGDKRPEIVRLCSDSVLAQLHVRPIALEEANLPESVVNELYRQYLYGSGQYAHKRLGKQPVVFDCVGDSLYQMLWQPLEAHLRGVKTIYYSTAGLLNRVAFNAIPASGAMLSDRYDLHYLTSTGMVRDVKAAKEVLPTSAMLYGGIDYDTGAGIMYLRAGSYGESSYSGSFDSSIDRGGIGSWGFLSASEKEVSSVAQQLLAANVSTKTLTGSEANEESFKALSGNAPALLHVATHGFFCPIEEERSISGFFDVLGSAKQGASDETLSMLRSGLLFSGANAAWRGEKPTQGVDDGILTADEISRLDLRGTDMVVLSACETGLGDEYGSEGIFGLQRAFKLAGARTLIMSLWKVPDAETALLMTTFYRHWLQGVERHEAFRRAQMAVREVKPNPYYWAGFVMMD